MTFDEAMKKGFLNLTAEEADKLLGDLFDEDDAPARLDAGLSLLGTFVSNEKITMVLDLAQVIIDANEEIEFAGGHYEEEDDD